MEIRQLLQRADTAANWLLVNPVLAIAEIGVEADTGRYKIGNGISSWTALGYARFDLAITRNATTVTVVATGDSAPLPAATPSLAGVMSAADKTKLDSLSTTQGDVLAAGNTVFTGINAFLNNSGITIGRGQAANDGVVILGRAGGTASRRVSLVPAVLSANRTLTLPDESGALVSTGSVDVVTGVMIAPLTITNANIASNAGISDGKLAAITAAGKVANSATTATASNTANAIVSRDGSGNFSAGLITAALSGNATTATRLQTARQINGVSFDGSAGITITAATPSSLTLSSSGNGAAAGSSFDGSTARVISYNSVGAPSTTGVNASGTWGISISGNAATASAATALQTGRTINGVNFNGTSDITITADTGSALTFNSGGAGAVSGTTFNGSAARTISYNTIGAPSTAGAGASGTWGIGISGNAATATRLATARTINGVSFDGSGNITLTANTGASLTFSNAGNGAVSGSTFNGSVGQTLSYNSVGAPSAAGAGASGTWGISITGSAASAGRLSSAQAFALTGDVIGSVSSNLSGGLSIATSYAAGSLSNADVAADAGIAGTKINPDFGNQNITTTGNTQTASLNNGPLAGFRNAIINGNFDIWQRGTSFNTAVYGADRWINAVNGSSCTMSRQAFTLGQTFVPGEPTYLCRMAVTSVAGAGNYAFLLQRIEDVRTFAGQQVTVSFWAKADASRPIAVDLNQNFGSGGSPSSPVVAIGTSKTTLSTNWQKITVTATVPSISGKTLGSDNNSFLGLRIWFDAGSDNNTSTNSLGQQSGTFDIAQVQVEPGPVATPFERRPIGTEFSLCERYYARLGFTDAGYAPGPEAITVARRIFFHSRMRITPNVSYTSLSIAGGIGAPALAADADSIQFVAGATNAYIIYFVTIAEAEL